VFTIARKEWHWLSHNPFEGVGKSEEGAQLHTLVVVALSTAARAGELVGLTWRDVDLKDGRVLLRKTKNSQPPWR
jgi:integrase